MITCPTFLTLISQPWQTQRMLSNIRIGLFLNMFEYTDAVCILKIKKVVNVEIYCTEEIIKS